MAIRIPVRFGNNHLNKDSCSFWKQSSAITDSAHNLLSKRPNITQNLYQYHRSIQTSRSAYGKRTRQQHTQKRKSMTRSTGDFIV